jgi:hypothetical protein
MMPASGSGSLADRFDSPMIIAVIAVGVMQMTLHQVIDVITVGNGFVTATGTMLVRCIVAAAGMFRRANVGVLIADLQLVLINVSIVRMMQMTIVKVIDMFFVFYGQVAAIGSVGVGVAFMDRMF